MARTKVPAKSKGSELFSVQIVLGDKTYKQSGPSIVAALEKFDIQKIVAKAVITVSQGKKKAETLLYPMMFRRLFMNRVARLIFEKRMTTMLK